MSSSESSVHFRNVSTIWTMVKQAHDANLPVEQVTAARQELLNRYRAVALRYLRGAFKHWPDGADLAEETFQRFAVKLLNGGLKTATPERGSFRAFLRAVLRNLATDTRRDEQQRRESARTLEAFDPQAADDSLEEMDQAFVRMWQEELLTRALRALEQEDANTNRNLYTVMRLYMDHPGIRSHEVAERLTLQLGRAVEANWVRKRLMQARQRFAELLVDEVRQSLDTPTQEDLIAELIDLGLYEHCRAVVT